MNKSELNESDSQSNNWLQSHIWWVVALVVAVLVLAGTVGFFNWKRGVNAEGNGWQNNSLAKYQGVQSTLSTCLDNTSFSAQVATQERETILQGMKAIVAARTANHQPAIPTDATIFVNAVTEAYPSISPDLYQQLMTTAVGCRNEVNGAQKDMQAYAARFKTWTKEGNIFQGMIRENYPNAELAVDGPNGVLTGQGALTSMATPIITSEAKSATKNKVMPSQNVFLTPQDPFLTPVPAQK